MNSAWNMVIVLYFNCLNSSLIYSYSVIEQFSHFDPEYTNNRKLFQFTKRTLLIMDYFKIVYYFTGFFCNSD